MYLIKNLFMPFILLALLLAIGCRSFKPGPTEEQDYIREDGITFGHGGDAELKLDLVRPADGKGPFPALIFLFGGGYETGSRNSWFTEIELAAERDYVAVAIDYRLTSVRENRKPKYPFPAQLHDAKCAVRWLRANAKKYNIDENHIGLVGFSAGGNLSLMLALTDSSDGLEGDCGDGRISSRVQAVVNLAGGTDLVMHYQLYPGYYGALLGGSPEEVPERYKAASPITYVSRDDPPVLTICGSKDRVLPQERLLDDKLRMIEASHTLIIIEGAEHKIYALVNFYEDNPVWDFFDKHLKRVED